MPPCRTAVEMRRRSMPDSLATMASASSEVCRCWVSKSAGTYSASITGVIGNTLRSRTEPFQVCESVAAVAIAGLARSVSARSSGTRMDLNICALHVDFQSNMFFRGAVRSSLARCLLQQLGGDEQHQPSAPKSHISPVADVEVENGKARGRQIVDERVAPCSIAATGKRERQLMHSRIVPDQHQPFRIGRGGVAD